MFSLISLSLSSSNSNKMIMPSSFTGITMKSTIIRTPLILVIIALVYRDFQTRWLRKSDSNESRENVNVDLIGNIKLNKSTRRLSSENLIKLNNTNTSERDSENDILSSSISSEISLPGFSYSVRPLSYKGDSESDLKDDDSHSNGNHLCPLFVQASTYGLIDFSIFEPNFCAEERKKLAASQTDTQTAMLDTNTIDCSGLMQFLYLLRVSTKTQVVHESQLLKRDAEKVSQEISKTESSVVKDDLGARALSYPLVMYINRISMFNTAHSHIVGAIISQRDECFSEQVRLLFVVNLRRFKTLVSEQFRLIWLAYQGSSYSTSTDNNELQTEDKGYCLTEKCTKKVSSYGEAAENWATRVIKLIDSDLKTFKSVLETWRPPLPEESHFYSHENDGRFTTLEMLRRATFNEWFVDQGLLRAALRGGIFQVGDTIADLGAGTGEYARWLNDTGLVDAFSYDGSADIELLTKKKVTHVNLVTALRRGGGSNDPNSAGGIVPQSGVSRKHNWVLLLEICEHIPAESHPIFFQNVNDFAKDGIILSWAPPQVTPIGHTNPLLEADVRRTLNEFLPNFYVCEESTMLVRQHSQVGWLRQTLTVLRRLPEDAREITVEEANQVLTSSCASHTEANIAYAGEDLIPGNANSAGSLEGVETASECCSNCKQNPDCEYWVWGRVQKRCWLKRNKEYSSEAVGFISGGVKRGGEEL